MAMSNAKIDRLCDLVEKAMFDLQMSPEEVGELLYDADQPFISFDEGETLLESKRQQCRARKILHRLPYGPELRRLNATA